MTSDNGEGRPLSAKRSRTLLVTFLGSIVRQMGNWMPIGGTIQLTAELGLDAPSVRTAVSRLKKRGWLVPEERGGVRGYKLSAEALAALAAGDELIWQVRQPANLTDGWCILTFTIPEAARARRDQLRSRISSLGFGNVSTATWMAPARMQGVAEQAIADFDLARFCAVFTGNYVAGADLPALVARTWDLEDMDSRYRAFIQRCGDISGHLGSGHARSSADAFATYMTLVDDWRQLPFRDPGLPQPLLPDTWSGGEAFALFASLAAQLETGALAHAARYWSFAR